MQSGINKRLSAIKGVMMKSLEKDFIPFPVNKALCSRWAKNIPYGGKTIMYTSFMYQLSGLFKAYEKRLSTFAALGGSSKLASLGKLVIRPDKKDLDRAYRILSNISALLSNSGNEHGYLYDDEPYSGGLLLELGMLDEFHRYGKKVLDLLLNKGVKRLITVDPHTTNAMKRLLQHFPADIEVVNYLSLINPHNGKGEFVLHDPCLYTRYDSIGSTMRGVLSKTDVELREDRMVTSRENGTCCGGPIAPVDYDLSDRIAKARAEKLLSVSPNVLVACPLCYQNLSTHIRGIKDISEVVS